jgi:SET domain-containing protein
MAMIGQFLVEYCGEVLLKSTSDQRLERRRKAKEEELSEKEKKELKDAIERANEKQKVNLDLKQMQTTIEYSIGFGSFTAKVIECRSKKPSLGATANHSCSPNATALTVKTHLGLKVILVSLADIEPDKEITYNYGWWQNDKNIPATECNCQAPNCRRYIEENSDEQPKSPIKRRLG